ncbi:class III poly(R)-hydroxyalkanoic acid synthase subunit PhaE [Luteimonas mephitis]|uniref:class III poly(R)-hydroxyalkanoic acid synthase subunit PhaE n=1 Tax=Luteimonas mephitis TaxID=83615 RepID=UPI0004044B3F|nr:class III poly(R)-hydroxyalkanoic acid synthase subunit PhaE [Luteimonas mephitis]
MRDIGKDGFSAPDDFEALARQYWNAWGEALRGASPDAAKAGTQPWQDVLDWWGRFAPGGRGQDNDVLARFNAQAGHWLAQMQQVAAQFGGQQASPREIVAAWKRAMESAGGNPFGDLMRGMRGHGLQGFEQWFEQASPYLEGLRNESLSWLRTPTFGFTREHQQRWQQLGLAMADYRKCTQAYDELMRKATQDAFAVFEDKLAEREEPGRQVQSARALFDLWVDAAEDAYAKIALSHEFRDVYGKLVDAQMRLRGGVQREVEQASALFGMPTRTELDGAHRKIVELERQVRRLRDGIERGSAGDRAATPRPAAKKHDAGKAAAGRSPAKKAAANAPVAKKAAAARKPAAVKKPAAAKTAKRKR